VPIRLRGEGAGPLLGRRAAHRQMLGVLASAVGAAGVAAAMPARPAGATYTPGAASDSVNTSLSVAGNLTVGGRVGVGAAPPRGWLEIGAGVNLDFATGGNDVRLTTRAPSAGAAAAPSGFVAGHDAAAFGAPASPVGVVYGWQPAQGSNPHRAWIRTSGNAHPLSVEASSFWFWSGADASLLLNNGPRVGIGTRTPDASLDVNGDARVRGALKLDSNLGVKTATPAAALHVLGGQIWQQPDSGTFLTTLHSPAPAGLGGDLIELRVGSVPNWPSAYPALGLHRLGAATSVHAPGGLSIGTFAGGSAPPGGGAIFSGRVGVGVAAPRGWLDVGAGVNVDFALGGREVRLTTAPTASAPATPAGFVVGHDAAAFGAPASPVGMVFGWQPAQGGSPHRGWIRTWGAAYPIAFQASSYTFENGSVGVGTAVPAARLDVVGDARVSADLALGRDLQVGRDVRVAGKVVINGVEAISAQGVARRAFYAP
jgi:hypothetical protein